jgi:hypothetical protein
MAKSQFVDALDEVQRPLTMLLSDLGFRRKGRAYNRPVGDSLVHVVNLQMGGYPIGDYVIPGIRESFYGRFTVNLGVLLPAVFKLEHSRDPPGFAQDYHCEIRGRLGALAFGQDTWWDLDHQVPQTARAIVDLMSRVGLPFLNQFQNYASVFSHLARTGTIPFKNEGRSALAAALICADLGERERADQFFKRALALADLTGHKGFRAHVMALRGALEI